MRDHLALRLCFLGALLSASQAGAVALTQDNFQDIRWLGRGNTGVAVINDGSSAFYNPAGLGFNEDYNFVILNPSFGGSQDLVTSLSQFSSLSSGDKGLTEKFSPFLGKPLDIQGSIFPNITIPNLVVGVWDYMNFGAEYRNPVNPELNVLGRNDYGIVVGTGKKYGNLSIGASLRYQRRKMIDSEITGSTLLTANSSYLQNLMTEGEAWGLNVGAQYRQAINKNQYFALGLAIEDVGTTTFINQSGGLVPDPQAQAINFGTAWGFKNTLLDGTLLLDVRQMTNSDISFTNKIFTGVEFSFLKMDLRGGFYQGYWTAGLSVRILPFLDLDFATYGQELDSAAGLAESRMWMIGISSGLELKKTEKKRQRFDLSNL